MTDQQIIDFSKAFTKEYLNGRESTGLCYRVCSVLVCELHDRGVECTLTDGFISYDGIDARHFWITFEDGRIIDPTAGQFNLCNIWLGNQPVYYNIQ